MKVDMVSFDGLETRGRLGNQLWQIAAAVGIARRLDAQLSLPRQWSYRRWFSLPPEWFAPKRGRRVEAHHVDAELGHIDPRAREYLQDAGLLAGVEYEVSQAFAPSPRAMLQLERVERRGEYVGDVLDGAVALHIRRGDLLTQTPGHQPVLPLGYYRRAIETFDDVRVVWVFSDEQDVEVLAGIADRLELDAHVKVMRSTPARSHQHATYKRQPALDWVDLQLMALATRHVIGNSTYAWWAAWLSADQQPRYPSQWHGPERAHIDAGLMFPDSWVQVPC